MKNYIKTFACLRCNDYSFEQDGNKHSEILKCHDCNLRIAYSRNYHNIIWVELNLTHHPYGHVCWFLKDSQCFYYPTSNNELQLPWLPYDITMEQLKLFLTFL